jgi:hypothetical protein
VFVPPLVVTLMKYGLRPVKRPPADVLALVALIGVTAALFGPYLSGQRVLIGNSDRINHHLPRLMTEVEHARAGETGYWDEHMLGGYNAHAWLIRIPRPVVHAFASFPRSSFLWIAAVATLLFMLAAGVGAYVFLRDVGLTTFPAWVAALLYQYASASTLRIVQNDWTFAVLVHIPFLYFALRRLARDPSLLWYGLSAALVASLLYFAFVQEAVYALLLAGSYCLYRGWKARSWPRTAMLLAPIAVGSIAACPRLWAVLSEQRLLERANDQTRTWNFDALYEFQNIRPYEIFRWLDDGFFGRYPSEVTTLGNNVNLSEGLQLYTSTFACLFLVVGVCGLVWLRAMRRHVEISQETDFAFHAAVLSFAVAVVVLKPVRHLVYLSFGGTDFTHTRVIITALLSQSVIVGVLLERCRGLQLGPAGPAWRRQMIPAGACMAALLTTLVVERAASRLGNGRAFQLDAPLSSNAALIASWRPAAPATTRPAPAFVSAARESPTQIVVRWSGVPRATRYLIEMKRDQGEFATIGESAGSSRTYRVGDTSPDADYFFRIRAGIGDRLTDYSEATRTTTSTWQLSSIPLAVPGVVMYRILIAGLVFAVGGTGMWLLGRSMWVSSAATYFLGFLIVWQAVGHANFRLNGDHTRARTPFQENNHYMPLADSFESPAPEDVELLQRRVENDRYRSVFVADPESFPVFAAPYLAPFWRLRALDGYLSGIPAELAALPWPKGAVSLRALSLTFLSPEALPWPLLAMCNVKYAIVVDEAFYRGMPAPSGWESTPGESVTIIKNPYDPTPREFFAAAIVPARDLPDAARQLFPTPSSVSDVTRTSVVEGLPAETFSVGGAIAAQHRQDAIDIDVTPSNQTRFLVVNERWHSGWAATVAGQTTPVYRVNATMRGIVVPEGATEIRLRFVPPNRDLEPVFLLAALGIGGLGAVGIRRHHTSRRFDL